MSEEYDDDFVDDLDSTKAPSPTVPKEPLQSQPELEVPSSSNQPTELPPPTSAMPNVSPVSMTETPIGSEPTPLITPSPNGESASTIAPATNLQPPDQPKELNSHDQAPPSTFVEESRVATHETQTDGAWEPRIVESEDTIVIGGARYRVSTAQRWSSKGVSHTTTGRVGSASKAQKLSHAPSYIANELRKIELIRPASASSQQQQQSVPRAAVGLGPGKRHPSPPATTMASYADKIVKAPSKEIISLSAFGEKSVCAAACTGDVEAMAKLVAQQVSLTGADAYSIVNTAGYVTIDRNRYGLKRVGASYTVGIGGKATPLQYACALGQTAAVKYLIDNGAVDSAVLGGAANGSAHSALPKPSLIAVANGFTAMKLLFKAPEKKTRRVAKTKAADLSAVAPQGDGVAEQSLIGGVGQAVLGLGASSNIAVPVVVEHVAELTSAAPIVTSSSAASTLPAEFTPVVDTPIASTTAAVAPSTEVAQPPLLPQSTLIEASAPPPAITQAPAAPITVPAASKDVVSSSSESFESDSS